MTADIDSARIELRTVIRVQKKTTTRVSGQIDPVTTWVDIGNTAETDTPRTKRCQWVNAHGAEAMRDGLATGTYRATLTMRYDARIDRTCRIMTSEDVWQIVSVDNVRQKNRWMEIIVERTGAA